MDVSRRYINVCNSGVFSVVNMYQPIGAHCGCFCFRGELDFLDCDDICMCVVNKHFGLLEFVFNSLYVDLKYNEISLTLLLGLCGCV